MIKNEPELLPFWLQYHSELFGIENIVVLDNYSNDERTHVILKEWETKGLRVLYKKGPYQAKGDLTVAAFKSEFPYHHVALPLDVDEFIVSYQDGMPVVRKQLIHQQIVEFWFSEYPCYGFDHYDSIWMHTENSGINQSDEWCSTIYPPDVCKKMIRQDLLVGLDHGNHHPSMRYDISERKCNFGSNKLGLLHYSAIDPTITVRKAIADCVGFGYLPANTTAKTAHRFLQQLKQLNNQQGVKGTHKVALLISYLENGSKGLLQNCTKVAKLGTLPQIVERLKLET